MKLFLAFKYVHILCAIVAVGFNTSYGIWLGLARREPKAYGFVLRGIHFMDTYVANPCYVGLGVTGPLMVWLAGYSWKETWIWLALALLLLASALGLGVFTPLVARQRRLLDERGPQDPEFQALLKRGGALGGLMALVVLAILFLMVFKPGA